MADEVPPKLFPLRMRTEEASEPLTTSLPASTLVLPAKVLTPVRVSVPEPFFQRPPLPPMAPETEVFAVVLKTPPVPVRATLWLMAVPLATRVRSHAANASWDRPSKS